MIRYTPRRTPSQSTLVDNFWLTKKQIDVLKAEHRKQRDRRLAYRFNAIILLVSGWSVSAVAQALLVVL